MGRELQYRKDISIQKIVVLYLRATENIEIYLVYLIR